MLWNTGKGRPYWGRWAYIYVYIYIYYIIICIHTHTRIIYHDIWVCFLQSRTLRMGSFPPWSASTHICHPILKLAQVFANQIVNQMVSWNNILQLTNSMDGLGSFPSLSHNEFHVRLAWDPFPDYQQLNKYFSNIDPFEDTQNMMCGFLSQQYWYTVRCVMTKQDCTWDGNHFILGFPFKPDNRSAAHAVIKEYLNI